jgi:hypothetical protein
MKIILGSTRVDFSLDSSHHAHLDSKCPQSCTRPKRGLHFNFSLAPKIFNSNHAASSHVCEPRLESPRALNASIFSVDSCHRARRDYKLPRVMYVIQKRLTIPFFSVNAQSFQTELCPLPIPESPRATSPPNFSHDSCHRPRFQVPMSCT